jgi:hypothetical protein
MGIQMDSVPICRALMVDSKVQTDVTESISMPPTSTAPSVDAESQTDVLAVSLANLATVDDEVQTDMTMEMILAPALPLTIPAVDIDVQIEDLTFAKTIMVDDTIRTELPMESTIICIPLTVPQVDATENLMANATASADLVDDGMQTDIPMESAPMCTLPPSAIWDVNFQAEDLPPVSAGAAMIDGKQMDMPMESSISCSLPPIAPTDVKLRSENPTLMPAPLPSGASEADGPTQTNNRLASSLTLDVVSLDFPQDSTSAPIETNIFETEPYPHTGSSTITLRATAEAITVIAVPEECPTVSVHSESHNSCSIP